MQKAFATKISRFIKHLSGLQSKQHEVQLLQQLLHTCINKTKKQNELEHTILHFRSIFQTPNSRCPNKTRNKTDWSTQSCIFDPSSKHQTLDVPFTRRHMHTSDTDTHVHMHNRTATYMNNQNQNSSKHINFFFMSAKT